MPMLYTTTACRLHDEPTLPPYPMGAPPMARVNITCSQHDASGEDYAKHTLAAAPRQTPLVPWGSYRMGEVGVPGSCGGCGTTPPTAAYAYWWHADHRLHARDQQPGWLSGGWDF